MPPRLNPAGDIGRNHQTIGSDILSVMRVISNPEVILGPEMVAQLTAAEPLRDFAQLSLPRRSLRSVNQPSWHRGQ